MKKLNIQLTGLSKHTGNPVIYDNFKITTDDLDIVYSVASYRANKYHSNPQELRACIYHNFTYLGLFYLENGEFYPSSYFDDRPNYLSN